MKEATWTLWGRDMTLTAGKLIEYQDATARVRVARVQQVRVLSVAPYTQVIDVKLYGPLTRQDGRRERIVQPDQVLRVLDAPPPLAKALNSLWSPRDPQNPFRIGNSTLTDEAWRQIALWYPFSVRVLDGQGSVPIWQEQARTSTWAQAQEAMTTLARLHPFSSMCWVVMKCERRGKEGREKPILWSPSQSSVERALKEG